ncbi:MAG: hypothetical protein IJ517_00560, partial [Alphaproteobacteria bacterium]|nr:hypothetical protein [Alphaproteobacteria bacterium]
GDTIKEPSPKAMQNWVAGTVGCTGEYMQFDGEKCVSCANGTWSGKYDESGNYSGTCSCSGSCTTNGVTGACTFSELYGCIASGSM